MALTEEQIEKFKGAEKETEDALDLLFVADDIAEAGDKEWAKEMYKKVENKSKISPHFHNLADSVYDNLGDKEWAKKLIEIAIEKERDEKDRGSGKKIIADSICKIFNDKEWAKKLYKGAEEDAQRGSSICTVADAIFNNLNDKEWAKKLYKKAEGMVEGSFDNKVVADCVLKNLEDKEWAKKVYLKALELVDDEECDEDDIAEIKEALKELG
tara:strand:- start:543 stop:1181 length:639 start_codon:yes stop_codon:yes gene_type:complete